MQSMFSGLRGIEAGEAAEVPLGGGLSLVKTNNYLLSARDKLDMTAREWEESANVSRYLVYKHETLSSPSKIYEETYEEVKDKFFSGLMALQVLKPIRTLGIIFYGQFYDGAPGAPAV